MRRFLILLVSLLFILNSHAALASDWIEGDSYTNNNVTEVGFTPAATATITPLSSFEAEGTIAPSGLQLHFLQAIHALELEIFAKKNTKGDVTERLDLLEKTVFGSSALPELPDNMQRLHRLLTVVPLVFELTQD